MDKGVRKILGADDRLTCGMKRTSPLDPILTKLGGGGSEGERGTNREKREKERRFLERETQTSLKKFR